MRWALYDVAFEELEYAEETKRWGRQRDGENEDEDEEDSEDMACMKQNKNVVQDAV